jgi:hypothetical protein
MKRILLITTAQTGSAVQAILFFKILEFNKAHAPAGQEEPSRYTKK